MAADATAVDDPWRGLGRDADQLDRRAAEGVRRVRVVPLGTLSTVFGIAGTAASTGPEVYSYGKLDIAFMAEDGIVQKAVREAAADLGLRMIRDCCVSQSKKIWNFVMQDDLNLKIGVTVEQRAAKLCLCQVDVGLLGSEPTARLARTRIKAHLPSSAAAPAGR
jgi:hypothetical protein